VDAQDLHAAFVQGDRTPSGELLLAIKAAVDADPRPGRYLLTGSSRLFGMAAAPDALHRANSTVNPAGSSMPSSRL
jgi:hypothetical protein